MYKIFYKKMFDGHLHKYYHIFILLFIAYCIFRLQKYFFKYPHFSNLLHVHIWF